MRQVRIVLIFIFSGLFVTTFAQTDSIKCNINKIKNVSDNFDRLTFTIVKDFLFTFDSTCNINVEYSEWSNEMLYKLIEKNPNLFFEVLTKEKKVNNKILLKKIESPIHDFDYQKIYNQVKGVKTSKELKEQYLRALETVANEEGVKLQK